MERAKAATLARQLMNEHGFGHLSFRFNRRKNALGVCGIKYRGTYMAEPVYIELSEVWVPHLSEAEVRDTILHEIAHAMTPDAKQPHGASWRLAARRIGANPTRTAESVPQEVKERVQQATFKYIAVCANNSNPGHFHYYFNRLGKRWRQRGYYRCPKCGGSLIPHELV